MKTYKYIESGDVEFTETHSAESATKGLVSNSGVEALINSGVEIAPYVEPIKTLFEIRAERDLLLAQNVDIYNPLRWAELTTEQKDSVKKYRQALLDITKQDPASAIWPEPPLT